MMIGVKLDDDGMVAQACHAPVLPDGYIAAPAGMTLDEAARARVIDGVWEILPERPGSWAVWDGTAWIDPRTEAEIAADVAAIQAQDRDVTVSRIEFGLAAVAAGIITEAECEAWVIDQTLPLNIAAAIEAIPDPAERFASRLRARSAQEIDRLSPLVEMLASVLGLTQEQVDALFGV